MNTSGTGGFTFGNSPQNPLTQNPLTQNPAVSTQAAPAFGGFSVPASTPSTGGFSLLSSAGSTTTSAATLSFNPNPPSLAPAATATTTAGGITFGSTLPPKTTKQVTFNFNTASTTSAAAPTTGILKTTSSVPSTSSTSAISTISTGSGDQAINYLQLHDFTNKWITDFGDLQKLLLNQTAETINRDVILASNEEKIENLVDSVRNLKSEQTHVEQQLDFIISQQKDLEECLSSLEDEVSSYFPELPADDMYKLAENIDSRLKKTLETSKEIITKINDKNRSSENVTNPMVAIGRILNYLTNSIQMLENLNAEGQTKLNDLQKMYQLYAA